MICVSFLQLSSIALADIVNGDFSAGLSGWNYGTDPRSVPFDPDYPISTGTAANDVNGGRGRVDLYYGGFDSSAGFPTVGSPFAPFLSQTFAGKAGDVLRFDAEWTLDARGGDAIVRAQLSGPVPTFGFSAQDFSTTVVHSQGHFSYKLPVTGTYSFKVSASAFGDYHQDTPSSHFTYGTARSTIFVDNVAIVPEPAAIAMLAVGAVVLALSLRHRTANLLRH
jgi:hypothetical protein